jgi:hypothetical protein
MLLFERQEEKTEEKKPLCFSNLTNSFKNHLLSKHNIKPVSKEEIKSTKSRSIITNYNEKNGGYPSNWNKCSEN